MESGFGLAAARQIVDHAVREATRLELPISVAVADEAGALLAGAVAVSGATSLQDHEIAERAALAINARRQESSP